MTAFAIYRLPHQQRCVLVEQTEGEPVELQSCAQLNGREGFVLAPFQVTDGQPILLLRPDRMEEMAVDDVPHLSLTVAPTPVSGPARASSHCDYAVDFANFHAQLLSGAFQKIVLARCAQEPNDGTCTPLTLFHRACQLYPRLFIALVSTPRSGTWLMATPEILLENSGPRWHTIALAGTMKLEGDQLNFDTPQQSPDITWCTKNIQEQRYVATYITECLEHFATDIREEGPRTVRAANLVHLRSDFTFTLLYNARVGDLLHALHPTPAVCGLPKREAFRFIVGNEQSPRRYYSGFLGPLGADTHLYVSLRCMNITPTAYCLYAGGGLLADSREEQEWLETEAKMETMRQLLPPRR